MAQQKLNTIHAKIKLQGIIDNLDSYTAQEFASAVQKVVFNAAGIDTSSTVTTHVVMPPEHKKLVKKHKALETKHAEVLVEKQELSCRHNTICRAINRLHLKAGKPI